MENKSLNKYRYTIIIPHYKIINLLGRDWYSDSINTVQGKEAYEQLQEAWIVEMAELSATRKAESEAVKHFISKREDIYRVALRHNGHTRENCATMGRGHSNGK